MKVTLGFISAILSLMIDLLSDPAFAGEESGLISAGRELISRNCSRCHAIAADDASRHPQALPFRSLGKRYPVKSLEEALAEGIFTGHPDMPEFQFQPQDINAVIAYLQSIQEN
jgi:cytochrome c